MPDGINTGLNSTALVFMCCMGLLLLVLPRRYALLPFFAAACYMTMGQVVKIAGLNFSIIRILVLVGWLRLLIRREFRGLRMNGIDRALLAWAVCSVAIYTLLWKTSDAFIYKCGGAYDAIGLYILFRALVREIPEFLKIFRALACLLAPLAVFMILEKFTGRNVFAVFGGVPDVTIVREGVLRCQGPFPHSILAGTFAAAMVPFFIALLAQKAARPFALLGICSATIITLTSGSSGPVMTYACAVLGSLLWPWRYRMRTLRRSIVVALLVLQMFMKVPVWFIIAHMGVFSGSTSYYRAFLIDQTIRHFSEWWLIGTKYQQPWAPLLTDITNMYVRVAFDGGLLALILFFVILKRSFAGVGRGFRVQETIPEQRCVWSLGVALFAHSMTFLAVWYWDQNIVNWYLLLAMISSVVASSKLKQKQPETIDVSRIEASATESAWLPVGV